MKAVWVKQSDLTAECWLIQAFGIGACDTCEAKGTKECGGVRIREAILKGEYPKDGIGQDRGGEG